MFLDEEFPTNTYYFRIYFVKVLVDNPDVLIDAVHEGEYKLNELNISYTLSPWKNKG